jgi:hypothetical protein
MRRSVTNATTRVTTARAQIPPIQFMEDSPAWGIVRSGNRSDRRHRSKAILPAQELAPSVQQILEQKLCWSSQISLRLAPVPWMPVFNDSGNWKPSYEKRPFGLVPGPLTFIAQTGFSCGAAPCRSRFFSEPCPVIRHPQPRRSIGFVGGPGSFCAATLGFLQESLLY